MLVAAAGCGAAKYWAVLGFEALLGLSVLTRGLALLVASNVAGGRPLASACSPSAGTLFWFLIRAMARLQMPERTR